MRLKSFLASLLTAGLLCLLITVPALAVPTLPSSFYGRITFNGGNVPDGTLVRVLINGQSFAEGRSQTYQGGSVYSLDVRGDDTDTPAVDGGREGDVLHFEVAGAVADQTATWHSGTNVQVDLTVTSASGPAAAPPTPAPVPNQTPIAVAPPAPPAAPAEAATPATTSTGGINAIVLVIGAVAILAGGIWLLRRRS